ARRGRRPPPPGGRRWPRGIGCTSPPAPATRSSWPPPRSSSNWPRTRWANPSTRPSRLRTASCLFGPIRTSGASATRNKKGDRGRDRSKERSYHSFRSRSHHRSKTNAGKSERIRTNPNELTRGRAAVAVLLPGDGAVCCHQTPVLAVCLFESDRFVIFGPFRQRPEKWRDAKCFSGNHLASIPPSRQFAT